MNSFRDVYASPNAPLDETRAWEILKPHWQEITETYARKGHLAPSQAKVEIDPKWHDSCRHFAAADNHGTTVCFAPELADKPVGNIRAVLAHEAGHVVDFANPGRYWFRPATQIRLREGCRVVSVLDVDPTTKGPVLFYFATLPTSGLGKHLRDWRHEDEGGTRSSDEIEFVADAIGSWIMGEPILYSGPPECLLETMGRGVPRPKGLR